MPALIAKPIQSSAPTCPLNDGVAVLDQLMAGLSLANEQQALDLALDLRGALQSANSAEAALELFFALRNTVEERHYLPCYRLRRWLQSRVRAFVRLDRQQSPSPAAVSLDQADIPALRDYCLATLGAEYSFGTSVRFAFADNP
ncbi:MAG: hypothetical protein IT582_00780 [Opitutaceae bacterium]|nr:hypothetical protein [Opitutaceae bacterium]